MNGGSDLCLFSRRSVLADARQRITGICRESGKNLNPVFLRELRSRTPGCVFGQLSRVLPSWTSAASEITRICLFLSIIILRKRASDDPFLSRSVMGSVYLCGHRCGTSSRAFSGFVDVTLDAYGWTGPWKWRLKLYLNFYPRYQSLARPHLRPPRGIRQFDSARRGAAGFSGLARILERQNIAMANAYMPE